MKNHKLGIIVPYRNRDKHLSNFISSIYEYIRDIDYELIVVEQCDDRDFNRGKLLNIGFLHAESLGCDYVVFHDVDMIPIDCDYSYSDVPTHLITDLVLPDGVTRELFDDYFGGVTLFPSSMFRSINGYTNNYYGWGYEDDNLLLRCVENNLPLSNKFVYQTQRDGSGLKFNGKDSYVVCPNVLNGNKDFTIVTNFSIDEIQTNKDDIIDEYSIFSVPGFDTTLTYNSLKNFTFQFWNSKMESIAIPSKHYPEGTYTAIITISNKSNPPYVEFILNDEVVGSNSYDRISQLKKVKNMYLGVGDIDREHKKNFLNGTLNSFAIYKGKLESVDKFRITRNIDNSLFNFGNSENIILYYDGKFINGNSLIDLSQNGMDGYSVNCKNIITTKCTEKSVPLPNKRNGTFETLSHGENGYYKGYWVNWATRENQIDYYDKYRDKHTQYQDDGLSTCKYTTVDQIDLPGYTLIKVEI